jgi:energy-coupling factor transporter ATP-binding protein EcfA2
LLDELGVADQARKLPSRLSGGQQQRVAIARSLANDPPIIVADEPSGNLDSANSEMVFAIFRRLASEGRTVVIATHDRDGIDRFDRVLDMVDGAISPARARGSLHDILPPSQGGGRPGASLGPDCADSARPDLGLFGVGAVLVAFTIIANDLDENFSATLPPNIVIDAATATPEAIAAIAAIRGVTAVEDRPAIPARIDLGLRSLDDDHRLRRRRLPRMRAARFAPQGGAWPPPAGAFLMERDGRFWVRDAPGRKFRLRLGDNAEAEGRLAGFAYDAGLAPSRMERMIYTYVTPETYRRWTGTAPPSRLLMRVDTGWRARARSRRRPKPLLGEAASASPARNRTSSPNIPTSSS